MTLEEVYDRVDDVSKILQGRNDAGYEPSLYPRADVTSRTVLAVLSLEKLKAELAVSLDIAEATAAQ